MEASNKLHVNFLRPNCSADVTGDGASAATATSSKESCRNERPHSVTDEERIAHVDRPFSIEPEEEQKVIDDLHASLDMIACPSCPKHVGRAACDCRTSMKSAENKEWVRKTINVNVCFAWEMRVLQTPGGFEYLGDQASHHSFTHATGVTPKHFARDFVQKGHLAKFYRPRGKLKDTVQCLLDLWVLRNRQWRVRYGTGVEAHKRWWDDGRPEYATWSHIAHDRELSAVERQQMACGAVETVGVKIGPPWHTCTVHMAVHSSYDGERAGNDKVYRVTRVQLCHEDCERGHEIVVEGVEATVQRAAEREGYVVRDIVWSRAVEQYRPKVKVEAT